ncbi:hypothetical protein CDL12_29099 [Handroanthus impetiginosus]|uniref:Uncharacterized protein n=1 Tax=Handroanthus impetiginosus TaxID=429701 RepID=A0A2G9FZE6_9LAMI|nr:hypothetical protein CDL12_29099 [Handroanthus impetiginosus]
MIGVFRKRKLDRIKRKYASLSIAKMQEYINKVKENKKRRNENKRKQQEVHDSYSDVPLVGKDSIPNDYNYQLLSIKWLTRAQMIPSQSKCLIIYDPICLEIYELKKVPNCIHCGAIRFEYKPQTFCCGNGKIKLASVQMPDEVYELYTSQLEEAVDFQKNIRGLNCIFFFTSFDVKLLYFVKIENEVENGMNKLNSSSSLKGIVGKLIKIMEINPYTKIFGRIKDYSSMNNVQLHISKNVKLDQRIYNSPRANQVATIWMEGYNPDMAMERDITVHSYSGHKYRIKHYYGCYNPLQYLLFFSKR